MQTKQFYVSKKPEYAHSAQRLLRIFQEDLNVPVREVSIYERYTIDGLCPDTVSEVKISILSEPPVDTLFETLPYEKSQYIIGREYIPGQYDQRADSTLQALSIITNQTGCSVRCAQFLVLSGNLSPEDISAIKSYYINPVDSQEASLDDMSTQSISSIIPSLPTKINGFITFSKNNLEEVLTSYSLAMTIEDLTLIQAYFQSEHRDPTETEIRVLDTYWSDHCRHTTFHTELSHIECEHSPYTQTLEEALSLYTAFHEKQTLKKGADFHPTLMNMATAAAKELREQGLLQNLCESDEINACTIEVPVKVGTRTEPWWLLFKNETHNHPTEIEPFGGAATCLGGCIRDPLSGRSYVYQAMRVSGCADPRTPLKQTLKGKLPQRVITTGAAHGYSSYGNQIGLATGEVREYYHPDFVAKRLELGAVLGAAPKSAVKRETPKEGDIIVLLGGATGRDGCGGATGSSKEHDLRSLSECGAEVQKGNPLTERKIQRLFRRPEVTTLIKKCNDFGAGGVSVAIGELADSLDIDLSAIPKKYAGLSATELAISESQERMALVLDPKDWDAFIAYCDKENINATIVARVTNTGYLRMVWEGHTVVNLSRAFLETHGASQQREAYLTAPIIPYRPPYQNIRTSHWKEAWLHIASDLNVASQEGLSERFDATIGASTVLMPYGGKYQKTPVQGMVSKLPVLNQDTSTASVMTHGFDPYIASWSPFHGAQIAVLHSVSKLIALGAPLEGTYLTLQEYFEKLGDSSKSWGKPTAALLGAYHAQHALGIAAIGGKDSMSGTFGDIHVPPCLISFAVNTTDTANILSPEFKSSQEDIYLLKLPYKEDASPCWEAFKQMLADFAMLHEEKAISAAYALGYGGIAEGLMKMSFGNHIGFSISPSCTEDFITPCYGSFIITIPTDKKYILEKLQANGGDQYLIHLGQTVAKYTYTYQEETLEGAMFEDAWSKPLDAVFPRYSAALPPTKEISSKVIKQEHPKKAPHAALSIATPKVLIPVFPGTNCEYDTAHAFTNAGAKADIFVIRNQTLQEIAESVSSFIKKLSESQILMFPGGFSAGDEPDGSGKYIAAFMRHKAIADEIHNLLYQRDGLILGICNGFQALIKLGLLTTGYVSPLTEESPTLTYNTIGRHISRMVTTKVVHTHSPWLSKLEKDALYTVPISHGEGRFVGSENALSLLQKKQQIATQYVNFEGIPTMDVRYNPNQSELAIEGITSPDGRIFGKMAHVERYGKDLYQNIKGERYMPIFASGVSYFK